jgi:ArsR family transcriptional regulator
MDDVCPVKKIHVDIEVSRSFAKDVSGLSELFKILGDETRTKIVYLLSKSDLCTCDLAEILVLTLPTISHHLRLLKAYRLVKSRREGKEVYYSLVDSHIVELIKTAKEHFEESGGEQTVDQTQT